MSHQNKVSIKSKAALHLALPLLIAGLIALVALDYLSTDSGNEKDFEELALGDEASSYFGQVDGVPVHCKDLENAHLCIDGYKKATVNDVILWLGNSQVHAINQMKQGDETASPILHRGLRAQKYFMTLSQPNANLQEHYLLFEYLAGKVPISTLVLPVF